MKIKLFTIPNILTLSNLVCGSVALVEILVNQNFGLAFILIIIAAAFDFLDGMAARLLGQYSVLGLQLDSLADMVSFGLVPSVAMFTLFGECQKWIANPLWGEWGALLAFSIVCSSALRLARFNIDEQQKCSFVGLPTPASALFCLSVAMLVSSGKIAMSAEGVALLSIAMSWLLISSLKLFSLKFNQFGWQGNQVRYIFIMISTVALFVFREFAIPVIIIVYLVTSLINNQIVKSLEKAKSVK